MTLESIQKITVIICAYTTERWDVLVEAVASLQNQSLVPSEIILSIDHNHSLFVKAREFFPSEISIIENIEIRGLSGARNSGIAASTGDLIAFLDDDAVASSDWLALLCSQFIENNVMGVGSNVEPIWDTKRPNWFPEEFLWVVGCSYKGLPTKLEKVRNPMGGSMCWRRNVFVTAGGFYNGVGRLGKIPLGCEETELCIRAQQKRPEGFFLYEPLSKIHHHVTNSRTTFSYFISRCYAEGISKAFVTYLVGSQQGLSSELTYSLKILPLAFLQGLLNTLHGDLSGASRSGVIFAGFLSTLTGYVFGKISGSIKNISIQNENSR